MPTRMKLTDEDLLLALTSEEGLIEHFSERRYKKRELITLPGIEENIVFIVKSGRIRVYLAYEEKEFTLTLLEKGDVFTSHTRAFTQALEDCVILVCNTPKFSSLIYTFPLFGLSIMKVLGDLLSSSISIINGLVFKDINLRLADFLLGAIADKGLQLEDGILLELGLNIEELATLLGCSRQTLSVVLNDFYKLGILERKGKGKLLIRHAENLRELASKA